MATYFKDTNKGKIFLKGKLGSPCADCNWISEYLCDFPVGNDKTCDRLVCKEHANRISDNIHYCNTHFRMWKNYIESGENKDVLPAKIIKME